MDAIQKFYSDIERIKKHNRDSSGTLNLDAVVNQISALFEANNRGLCGLPHSLIEFWISRYVQPQLDSSFEDISSEAVEKLCAMQAFLNNENDTDCLTLEDWQQIADSVNYEAEELPMDLLSQMMMTLVEKRAI
ncbi:MAG: hypothetical protein ACI4MA_11025 [Treponema sp.]